MSYMNDPREMAIRPESGVTLEQDNRVETMYHWGAMITDLCDLPVSEYMKPMTVIVYGSNGEYDPEYPGTTIKNEDVKIWFTVLRNGNEVTNEPSTVLAASEVSEVIWTARWEWVGSFSNKIKVAAVIQTDKGMYNVSATLEDIEEKVHEETITELVGEEELVSYKSYGVASESTPNEKVTGTTYSELVEEENTKYNFEISSAETIVYVTLKLTGVANPYTNKAMRFGDDIPFDKVSTDKEGYDFLHWVDSKGNVFTDTKMPAADLTLTAKYEAKKCNVSFIFVINGFEDLVSSTTVSYGSRISKFPTIDSKMYISKGWEPSTSTIIKEDTVFRATLEYVRYIITWNGYADGPIIQDWYKYNDFIEEPEAPTKDGNTFKGWDKTIPERVTSNATFNAKFEKNSYVITFKEEIDGNLTTLSAKTMEYDSTIVLPKLPSEKGYTYSNWKSDYTGTKVPSYPVTYITEKTRNSYILSYYDNNVFISGFTYEYTEPILHFQYDKEGYVISDWEGLPETMPYHNVSAYCRTEIMRFTVVFIDQDGNRIELIEGVPYGTQISELAPVAPEGYSYEFSEGTMDVVVKNDMIVEVTKTINYYDVTINNEVVKLPYGEDIIKYVKDNNVPEEGYHIFITSKTHDFVPSNNSAVVEFIYEPNIWSLSYATTGIDENLIGSKYVAFGTNILSELPETNVEGYLFDGWYENGVKVDEDDTMPNRDFSVEGTYEIEMFEVIFTDGEEIITTTCEYKTLLGSVLNNSDIVNYVVTQSANGYTTLFTIDGEPIDENMEVKSNIEIYMDKTPNEYILIFKNGDIIISEKTVKFGDTIIYPEMSNEIINGVEYVFVWDNSSYNTMPANDLIITGHYQEKSVAPIYYGSFVIPTSSYTADNLSDYVNESDLESEYFKTVAVAECIGIEKALEFVYPAYPPFIGLNNVKLSQEKKKYYEPLTVLLPVNVAEKYNISLKDGALGTERWGYMVTDNKVKTIKGNDYYVFAIADDGTRADKTEKTYKYKLQITEK